MGSPSIIVGGVKKVLEDVFQVNDDGMLYIVPILNYFVDEGRLFVSADEFSLSNGSSVQVLFSNPLGSDVYARLIVGGVGAEAKGTLDVYRDVTVSSHGTEMYTFNLNLGMSDESQVSVEYGGTYGLPSDGLHYVIYGGKKRNAIGSLASYGENAKVPPGHNLLYVITNTSGSTAKYDVEFMWIEMPLTSQ